MLYERHKNIDLIQQELILKMIIIILTRYCMKNNLKIINNSSNTKSVNFKILLYSCGTYLIDSLLFSKSRNFFEKILDNSINWIYNSINKHKARTAIKNRGKWYNFSSLNYTYEPD